MPHRARANLGWAWQRYTLRFGTVYTSLTPFNGVGSAWQEPLVKYDLGGSFRLTKYATLFFQGRNITNETRLLFASQTDVRGEAPYLFDARNFGVNWLFGIKGTF